MASFDNSFRRVPVVAILCATLAILALSLPTPLFARTVRIATWNIERLGSQFTGEYLATSNILRRIDADIVGFQELTTTDRAQWEQLASDLGYEHTVFGDNGDFSGNLYLGFYSRHPIVQDHTVTSPQFCPSPVMELTRAPLRIVAQVFGAEVPLIIYNMHHKAGSSQDDQFRRAIEARRIREDLQSYLHANPTHDEYIVLGDMNDDNNDSQTLEFFDIPDGVPISYSLGCDITFPIPYATFPQDAYEDAGLHMVPAYHTGLGFENATRPASGRRLDYILVSTPLMESSTRFIGEVYNSATDGIIGGYSKVGSPLSSYTSTLASDHLPVLFEVKMSSILVDTPQLEFVSFSEEGVRLRFPSLEEVEYHVHYIDELQEPIQWRLLSSATNILGTGEPIEVLDDGSTLFEPHPAEAPMRYYRLIGVIPR